MFQTCSNFQVFSENVQRYRVEIAAGLHVGFDFAALREKNCSGDAKKKLIQNPRVNEPLHSGR